MFTFLLTDIFFFGIIISLFLYIKYVKKTPDILATWMYVFKNKTGIISVVVLSFFLLTAFLDSIHLKSKVYNEDTNEYIYSSEINSVLDIILLPMHKNSEKSYSSPFASKLYSKETIRINNKEEKEFIQSYYLKEIIINFFLRIFIIYFLQYLYLS